MSNLITRQDVISIINKYNSKDITVGTIGSHSALEIMDGAKDENMKTLCICEKGRETPYKRFKRITDEIVLLNKFSDIMSKENQKRLLQSNTIIIAHRAFTAYLGYDNIETKLYVPIFGNRSLLRAEERNAHRNQYYLLEKARIKHPRIYNKASDIDGLAMVKIQSKTKIRTGVFLGFII